MTRNPVIAWLVKALREYRRQSAPVTYGFVGLVSGIYGFEALQTFTRGLPGTDVFATGLFAVAPAFAWLLAPFLHANIDHVLASVFGLLWLGIPLEEHFSRWRYVAFLVGSGYLATLFGAIQIVAFAGGPIAAYGSSGTVFALSGFALVHLPRDHLLLSRIEWLAVGMGVLSLMFVVVDPFTGPYFGAEWVNGGHVGGFVVGLVAGSRSSDR